MFIRSKNNPILKPIKRNYWEARKVYNCGVIYNNKRYHLFYRAVGDDWISRLGHAVSKDGENFKRVNKPILFPENDLEIKGIEDPRISKINNIYYLTFTAYDGITARLNFAISSDLKKWEKHGAMMPNWNAKKAGAFRVKWDLARNNKIAEKQWLKAGGIFPKIIKNKYWMLFGDSNIWLANSRDGINWSPIYNPFIKPRKGNYFDNAHVEMGPPPIKTDLGWLALYHGINNKIVYSLGFLILDLDNPAKILYRSSLSVFEPEEPYELSGLVDVLSGGFKAMETMKKAELNAFIKKAKNDKTMPNVVFCCGAVVINGILRIYYGDSDSVISTATAKLNDILDIYKESL